jgi:hypothetical protein
LLRSPRGAAARFAFALTLALGACLLTGNAALAERRVALVIGNASYRHADVLANTINDANAVASLLSNAGFDVVDMRTNLGVAEFKRAMRQFVDRSANADVAVVYYSGHGLEVGGVNYLIPIDASLSSVLDMDDQAISLDRLLAATGRVKKLSLIILDACRENPFRPAPGAAPATPSISAGLAGIAPTAPGMLIAFAAKAGSVSFDGAGPNSPFTSALVKYIAQPGQDIRIALGKVRDEVLRETGNRQEPYVYGSLGGEDVALVAAKPMMSAAPSAPSDSIDLDAAADYRTADRIGSIPAWRAFLSAHSSGGYADQARAQLATLLARKTPSPAGAQTPEPSLGAGGAGGGAKSASQQPSASETATLTEDEACRRDAIRLAQVRSGHSAEDARNLASELKCEKLRPQLLRLMESLGFAAPAPPPASPPPAGAAAEGPAAAPGCESAQAALDRLRAEPTEESVRQFWRDLSCEQLRPQVRLLMESLNLKPEPTAAALAPRAAERPAPLGAEAGARERGFPAPAGGAPADQDACARELAELNRIRANPDLSEAERFAKSVTCDALKPQAERLLGSLAH